MLRFALSPSALDKLRGQLAPLLWIGLTIWGLSTLWFLWAYRPFGTLFDYQAFYCGGRAILHHANPYLNGPLHQCEASVSPAMFKLFGNVTIPAPLPPYALVLFTALALLPWSISAFVWTAMLVTSVIGTIVLTQRLTKAPLFLVAVAMTTTLIIPSLVLGSLAPLPIFLTVVAAYLLQRQRWTVSAIALVASMIEPHVALPAVAAVFLFVPQMRVRLLVGAATLIAISIAAVGFSVVASYPSILSAHSLSEVSNTSQYSLTWLLHNIGVPAKPATLIGFLQYAALSICGVAAAQRIAKRDEPERDWYITVPVAFAIVGGNFIHITQMGYAFPPLLALYARRNAYYAPVAMLLLCMPWQAVFASDRYLPLALLALLGIMRSCWRVSLPVLLAIGGVIVGTEYLAIDGERMVSLLTTMVLATVPHSIANVAPSALADVTWTKYLNAYPATAIWTADKVPTWLGLLAMVGICAIKTIHRVSIVSPARQVLIAALAGLATATIMCWENVQAGFRGVGMGDFRAFQCAAHVALNGGNPYLFGQLYACESHVTHAWFYTAANNIALPAPLPPYALALLAPVANLQLPVASVIWGLLTLLAAAGSALLVSRMTTLPRAFIIVAFLTPTILALLPYGEITPLVCLALIAAATTLHRGTHWLTALCIAAALIEPHVSFPVVVAVFVWEPRTRVPLIAASVGLAALAGAFVGWPTTLAYVTTILPAHMASEIGRNSQLSLSSVLYTLGTPEAWALRIGMTSYLAMTILGVFASKKLADQYNDRRFIVLTPAAAVLFGGTFLHINQVIFALPFALLLLDKNRTSRFALPLVLATIGLAIPWMTIAMSPLIALPCLTALIAMFVAWKLDEKISIMLGLFSGMAWFLITSIPSALPKRLPILAADPAALAEVNWSHFVALTQSHWDVLFTTMKLPTWIALGTTIAISFVALVAQRTAHPTLEFAVER